MVRHIVMWKLLEENRDENGREMKKQLEALVGVVPGLRRAEVTFGFGAGAFDICLYSELDDENALQVYQGHPEHLKVKKLVHAVTCERVYCDSHF
jgi:CRISPR/Cas system CSM-associated protein Csm5 (group 7 of RAMP superfamily)